MVDGSWKARSGKLASLLDRVFHEPSLKQSDAKMNRHQQLPAGWKELLVWVQFGTLKPAWSAPTAAAVGTVPGEGGRRIGVRRLRRTPLRVELFPFTGKQFFTPPCGSSYSFVGWRRWH